MDRSGRKKLFGEWLDQAWNVVLRTAEAIEQSPVEELLDRVNRLEREVTALKRTATDAPVPGEFSPGVEGVGPRSKQDHPN